MKNALHPDNPVSMGCFGMPEIYTEAQMSRQVGVVNSYDTIKSRPGRSGETSRAGTITRWRPTGPTTRTTAS
jgi:hypothetical protein